MTNSTTDSSKYARRGQRTKAGPFRFPTVWSGVVFVPGVSLERALSLLQNYDNHCRTYKPDVRRSKLLEHADDTFKIYLQFYRDSPRRVSFNTEFEVHYTRIDATHAISRATSVRIAELEHPDQPDSSEFAVGQGHGYLWRLNNYWRLEEKDGGVYMQADAACDAKPSPVDLLEEDDGTAIHIAIHNNLVYHVLPMKGKDSKAKSWKLISSRSAWA